jgi:hypothetical protein
VELWGKTLTAWLGAVKLFTGVQIELAIPRGAPGLYSVCLGSFIDNFDVARIQPR